jgi:nucleotide-binding universal stress UspA family protein
MVPLDGSKEAEAALEQAKFLASAQQGKIVLVQSCPGPITADYGLDTLLLQPPLEQDRELVAKYLDSVKVRLEQEGLSVETRVLDSGDPAHRILEELEQRPVDLIVLTTHGRSGLSRFLMGSVAEKVARHAPCPVFLVRRKS